MTAVLCGVMVGLALGLTGGGGSILAVPILVYLLEVPLDQAVAVSLLSVAAVAVFGAVGALRHGMVAVRAALILAAGGVAAAPVGVAASTRLDPDHILIAFALLMLAVAAYMWRQSSGGSGSATLRAELVSEIVPGDGPVCRLRPDNHLRLSAPCGVALVLAGLVTGVFSGVFGVGGGFLIVPALAGITQLSMQRAVATSLLVISLVSSSGVVAALVQGRAIPWGLAFLLMSGGLVGMGLGQKAARRMDGALVQKAFAVLAAVIGVGMLMF